MSLRVLHQAMTRTDDAVLSSSLAVDLDLIADHIRQAGGPVPLSELARVALHQIFQSGEHGSLYTPGGQYRLGERIRLSDGRVGDVVALDMGENERQGHFKVLTVRFSDGSSVALASEAEGAEAIATADGLVGRAVDRFMVSHGDVVVREVRQALGSDPRFITLYDQDGEYGCLREFFPPMSPEVLDAAVALLLDNLFEQVPLLRMKSPSSGTPEEIGKGSSRGLADVLFVPKRLTVPEGTPWATQARALFDTVRALWGRMRDRKEGAAEDQTQRSVLPVLHALGWTTVPLPGVQNPYAYALCKDEFMAAGLYMEGTEAIDPARWMLAVLQVVPPEAPMDGVGASETVGVDATAAVHRLAAELQRQNVRWGILTDGTTWRLFSRDSNSLTRTFYEINLSEVMADVEPDHPPDPKGWEMFQRWLLLFHRNSYVREADGHAILDRLRDSEACANGRTLEVLRQRLSDVALPTVVKGLLDYRKDRLGIVEETPATLQLVHQAAVVWLTRLAFLLLAEGRQVLPLTPAYRPYSLTVQALWAVRRMAQGLPLSDSLYTTPRYDLVRTLLHRVCRGDEALGLPPFGRLFYDPAQWESHAILEHCRLSDRVVAVALDALYRDVDYGEFSARQLVAACAGLAWGKLSVVNGEISIQTEPRPDFMHPLPDFVVSSAIAHGVAPLLQERAACFNEAMEDVVGVRKALCHVLDRDQHSNMYAEWEAASRRAREAFLGIKVGDPYLRLGECLLGAVDVLTDGILTTLHAYHEEHPDVPRKWNPLYRWFDEIRADLIEEIRRQGGKVPDQPPSDAQILSWLVTQRCVFGVAPTPVALEVARIGLWAHSMVPGAPLALLDHHLGVGNALLGLRAEEATAWVGGDTLMAQVGDVARDLFALAERVDTSVLDIRWSINQFERVREAMAPWTSLFDLVLSAQLGDSQAKTLMDELNLTDLSADPTAWMPAWLPAQAEAEGFFHWELRFPELFIDLSTGQWRTNPGFDMVVGSPPLIDVADSALRARYAMAWCEGVDGEELKRVYLYLAQALVKRDVGRVSYVLSRAWLRDALGGV